MFSNFKATLGNFGNLFEVQYSENSHPAGVVLFIYLFIYHKGIQHLQD